MKINQQKGKSMFFILSVLSWFSLFYSLGSFVDYISLENKSYSHFLAILDCFIALLFWLLPFVFSVIQYRYKKIEKSILKYRIRIWSKTAVIFALIILIFYLVVMFILFSGSPDQLLHQLMYSSLVK